MSSRTEAVPPLPRAVVVMAVERHGPCRLPLVRAKWWGEGLEEQYGERLRELDRFPEDVVHIGIDALNTGAMGQREQRLSTRMDRIFRMLAVPDPVHPVHPC